MDVPAPILLVEDNDDDVVITKRAFEHAGVANPVVVARDGDEALAYLRNAAKGGALPGLVLLDLNLPRIDGFTVLAEIKSDAQLRSVPVIVLTTSRREEDVARCYSCHANSYLVKPPEFERFIEMIGCFHRFWNETATLPTLGKNKPCGKEAA